MATFAESLYVQLQADPDKAWTPRQGMLFRWIESGQTQHGKNLQLVEQLVRARFGLDPTGSIDWGIVAAGPVPSPTPVAKPTCMSDANFQALTAINWQLILQFLETILPIIIQIIQPLIG